MSTVPFLVVSLVVLGAAVAEAVVARALGRSVHRFEITIANLGAVLGNIALSVLLHAGPFLGYAAASELALFELPADSPWTWIAAIVGLDLCFYAQHRLSHRVRALWVLHEVHHSAEDFNVSVAMRAPWGQAVWSTVYFLPLALVGVPVPAFTAAYLVFMLWGPLVHTRLVGRLGVLDRLFVTPSNHRVHHGRDARYLDANYASIFAVIDRVFGSFVEEDHEPEYGLVHPPARRDPVSLQIDPFLALARDVASAPTWADSLRYLCKPPGWRPAGVAGPAEGPIAVIVEPTVAERRMSMGLVGLALVVTAGLVVGHAGLPIGARLAVAGVVLALLWSSGAVAGGAFRVRELA